MAFIISSKSKSHRRFENMMQYHSELQKKATGKLNARTGRPGEKEQLPDLGKEFWDIRNKQAMIKSYE